MSKIHIGAHVSSAGGCYYALKNANNLGVFVLQMFGSSPRQYQVKVPLIADIDKFDKLRTEYCIQNIFLHAPYLVNLASLRPFVRHQSRQALEGHLQIANMLNADGVVFHIGSVGVGGDKEKGLVDVISGIEKIYDNVEGSSILIIENGSGGGGKIGSSIDDMATIVNGVKNGEVGICLDTAHIYASGVLDFTEEGFEKFSKEWDKKINKGALKVLHLNDSKSKSGSFLDRHENIGKGFIGREGFVRLSEYDPFNSVPWILEVPGFSGNGPDKENIDILNEIVKQKNAS